MSKGKKIWMVCGGVVLLAIIVFASIRSSRKDVVLVQTTTVQRKDVLSSKVTASGEIRAKKFVDLQSEISGIITELPVREGDSVKKGDILLRIDPIQTDAETSAARAQFDMNQAQARAQEFEILNAEVQLMRDEASLKSARAELEQAENNFARAQNSFNRQQQLYEDGLISRDSYESAQNDFRSAKSRLDVQRANLLQMEKQINISKNNIERMKTSARASQAQVKAAAANLAKASDQSRKSKIESPMDGVITQLKKEKGERAVPGMMTSPEATIMTIADLSTIQAQLKVDETDIVNLSLGDIAQVKVDALPDVVFEGEVTEIGNSPIDTATSSQEAKDFKVIVTLKNPSKLLRPGMSCTGEITTDTRRNVIAIPLQALTVRDVEVDKDGKYHMPDLNRKNKSSVARAASEKEDVKKKELEGVFVVTENKIARFRPIKTGITGESEIEVLENLNEKEEIVSGSYQTLRTIKDGATVKIDKASKSQTDKKS
ncbi:MAG: efflux RND transporter periplasmic adaptor subunit [Acidobacteriota bacterium]|jgi:HlyD family secretion protein|nr:efflux RND transporter periplasmic adaptor subunit [Acidobacteriota bacterium]